MNLRKGRRGVLGLTLTLALIGIPVAAHAEFTEFIAAILKFYLLEQPQQMNHAQDVVDANLQAADAITRKNVEIWQKQVVMAMLPPPQSCVSLTLAKALRVADSLVPGTVNQQINQGIHTITGNLNPVQTVIERVRRHESQYCSASDQARGRCTATTTLPNGDLDASLLLDSRGYTPEQDAAAQAFLENLTAPAPLPTLPAHLEKTPQADQLRGYLIHYAARKAIAQKVLANAYAERKRPPDGQSAQDLLYADYERRFGDPTWADQVLKSPPGSLDREKLMMQAWQMQMQMRNYRQQQDLQMVMATLLDVLTEQQAEQKIAQLTEAAMRAKVEDP